MNEKVNIEQFQILQIYFLKTPKVEKVMTKCYIQQNRYEEFQEYNEDMRSTEIDKRKTHTLTTG